MNTCTYTHSTSNEATRPGHDQLSDRISFSVSAVEFRDRLTTSLRSTTLFAAILVALKVRRTRAYYSTCQPTTRWGVKFLF